MIGNLAIDVAEVNAISIKRGADRATGVTRRRRYENAFEARFREDARVRDSVQCDAAPETEICQAGLLAQRSCEIHESVLQNALHARSAIGEPAGVFGVQTDRRAQTG